jgi:hypothetical protein
MHKYLMGVIISLLAAVLFTCSDSGGGGSFDPSSPATPGNDFFIFVDITNGDTIANGAAGTAENPLNDIEEGIGLADAANKNVCVAAGAYEVDSGTGTMITLIEGVSLYGGYSADGKWKRNITLNTTSITDTAVGAGLHRAVWCGAGITSATVVDGFTINAATANGATAVYCQGDCTLSHNTINGFQGPQDVGTTSYALYIQGASPVLMNCILYGGNHSSCYGIYMFLNSSPVISGNSINGGGGSDFSDAIFCMQSTPQITDNSLNCGSANLSRCIFTSNGSTPTVEDNVFVDGGGAHDVAFTESSNDDEPASFIGNEFGAGFETNYLDFSGGIATLIDDIDVINALDENGHNPAGTVDGNFLSP